MSEPPRQNVEQKFRCEDLEAACAAALAAGAIATETMHQRDVYFHAHSGRLKLRSINSDKHGESHELIAYKRADEAGQRICNYHVVRVESTAAIRAALASVLGVRATVSKRRRLLLYGSMRIHLDEVEDLGSFVEFEYVLSGGEDAVVGRTQIACWREVLALREPVPVSYVDLIGPAATLST